MKTDQFSGSYPTQRGKRLRLRSLSNGKLLKQLPIIYINKWIGNTNEYGEMFNKLGHAIITLLFIFIYKCLLWLYKSGMDLQLKHLYTGCTSIPTKWPYRLEITIYI